MPHKGRIYTSTNWVNIGSDNGLLPVRRQTVTWANGDLLSVEPLGTDFGEIWIQNKTILWRNCNWKCLGNGGHFFGRRWVNTRNTKRARVIFFFDCRGMSLKWRTVIAYPRRNSWTHDLPMHQPLIQAQIKENIKAPLHWPLWGEFTGDRWIPRTKDQWRGKISIWWRHHAMLHIVFIAWCVVVKEAATKLCLYRAFVFWWMGSYKAPYWDPFHWNIFHAEINFSCGTCFTGCYYAIMMTSSHGNILLVTGSLCREFTGYRWIPLRNANRAELWCFLWFVPE